MKRLSLAWLMGTRAEVNEDEEYARMSTNSYSAPWGDEDDETRSMRSSSASVRASWADDSSSVAVSEYSESLPPQRPTLKTANNDALISGELIGLGVSLDLLKNLDVGSNATFEDAKQAIMDLTRSTKGSRSLAAHLLTNPETQCMVGKAQYFVSYAWQGGFGATMHALTKYFEGKPSPFLWMDIAMMDQYALETTEINIEAWSQTFEDCLRRIGNALLVLTPAARPLAVGRLWCCFEWAWIRRLGIPFDYCTHDVEDLARKMESGMGFVTFKRMFIELRAEESRAFRPSDQAALLKLMRNKVGLKNVNDANTATLKDFFLNVARDCERLVIPKTKEEAHLLNAIACIHNATGNFNLALPLFQRALASAQSLPDAKLLAAKIFSNIATVLQSKGELTEAERMFRESLAIRRRELGNDHDLVAVLLNNIASLLKTREDFVGAELLLRESIDIGERTLGREHPDVTARIHNLAGALFGRKDYAGALTLYREAFATSKKTFGADHPDTIGSLASIGHVLQEQKHYRQAEPILREVLALRMKALGDAHPAVAQAKSCLGALLATRCKKREAKQLLQDALKIYQQILGPDHEDIAKTLWWLASVMRSEGDRRGALETASAARDMYAKILGQKHQTTIRLQGWINSLC